MLSTQPDARLVALARDGSEDAFEEIVRRYRTALLRYSRGIVTEGAEDAVQHAFLNAHRALRRGDQAADLRPWLYRLTRNAAIDVRRRQGPETTPLDLQIDGVEQPHDALMKREALSEIVTQVARLPRRQREALVLREFEGRGHDEIAELLGVSGGAVRQLIHRARGTLRSAAALLVPPGLVERLAGAGAADQPARVAEIVTGGAGLGVMVVKGGAVVLATSAVVLGGIKASSIPAGDRATAGVPTSRSAGTAALSGPDRRSERGLRMVSATETDDSTARRSRDAVTTQSSPERARDRVPAERHRRAWSEPERESADDAPEQESDGDSDALRPAGDQPGSQAGDADEPRREVTEPDAPEPPGDNPMLIGDDSAPSDVPARVGLAEAANSEPQASEQDDEPTN